METLTIIFFIIIVLICGFLLYLKFNYVFMTPSDKQILNSSFSFLNDDYLNDFVKKMNIQE